jgi:hypothetical protein
MKPAEFFQRKHCIFNCERGLWVVIRRGSQLAKHSQHARNTEANSRIDDQIVLGHRDELLVSGVRAISGGHVVACPLQLAGDQRVRGVVGPTEGTADAAGFLEVLCGLKAVSRNVKPFAHILAVAVAASRFPLSNRVTSL